jgi:F-type H+-transporting ATPase subunit b
MPQLDTSTFSSQIFWLCVCFLALYFILSYIALPKISRVLEERDETREEKINKASTYREQAEDLLVDYEKTLGQARDQAQKHYKAIVKATTSQIANQQNDFLDKLNERLHLTEQALYRARLESSQEIGPLAVDVAKAILIKLTGHPYSSQKLLKQKEPV